MQVVRPANAADQTKVLKILKNEALDLYYEQLEYRDFWVVEVDGLIAGSVQIEEHPDFCFLGSLGILPEFQHRGLANLLVNQALKHNTKPVYLYTIMPDFFKPLGFQPTTKTPASLPPKTRYECQRCEAPGSCAVMIRPSVKQALLKSEPSICELSYSNLTIWRDFDRPEFTYRNGLLCLKINPLNEEPFFLEPVGDNKIEETVDLCLQETGRLARVSEKLIAQLPADKYKVSCSRNHFDYIYERSALAELKGKKFDGKRNHVKGFQRRHQDYQIIRLSEHQKDDALPLFEEWFKERQDSRYFPKMAHEAQRSAITRAFDNFEELDLLGCALYINNEMKGFILGSRLNSRTAAIHFLYAHPAVKGIFQVLLWEACRTVLADFELINLEQDLGIPGLRKAKLSNQPVKLEKKFEAVLRSPLLPGT